MISKLVKTRKDHECLACNELIKKGSNAWFFSEKQPKYDKHDDKQIGINYFKGYYHPSVEVESEGFDDFKTFLVPSCQVKDVI
jgi:hypothetical protein